VHERAEGAETWRLTRKQRNEQQVNRRSSCPTVGTRLGRLVVLVTRLFCGRRFCTVGVFLVGSFYLNQVV